jgi:uncharacterized protein DUF4386
MSSVRKLAIAAGVCYLVTHVTSVPAAILYGPILNRSAYILGSGPDTAVALAALLEVICALGIVGTAVALFPVVKRQHEGIAMGYVGLRTLEAGIIAVGVLPLLTVVTLRQQFAGAAAADSASLVPLGQALVELHNWTAILGPGLICPANTALLAYLMYRSGLVARFIPVLGLVGAPLVFAYNAALLFGLSAHIPAWAAIGVIPIFAWEVSLAIYLIARGFKPSAIAALPAQPEAVQLLRSA